MKVTIILSLLLLTTATTATAQDTTAAVKTGQIHEVVVSGAARRLKEQVASTQMGRTDLPVQLLLKVPAIGGERDIIKALQLTPGIKRGTEGGIGMYVRGGGNDENLILLDGATVYNAGHLLGFFSVFNAASLKDVQLYKAAFPAQYGGRLSSVMDVRTKDGSLQDYKADGSIGLIASSMSVQGPILRNKLSFALSARRTYIDQVLHYVPYNFYDVNAKLTCAPTPHDRISLSTYKGDDVLKMATLTRDTGTGIVRQFRTGMKLGNATASLIWKHTPEGARYSTDICVHYSGFRYQIAGSLGSNALYMRSAIRDLGVRGDYKYLGHERHKLAAGFSLIHHYFNPNIVQTQGRPEQEFAPSGGRNYYSTEAGLYVNDDYKLNDRWQLAGGLRISGDAVAQAFYWNPEPRMGLRYLVNERSSVKASYARMAQYMHLVSSSSIALPTDLWYPATATIRPGLSDQVSAGYYYNIPALHIGISAEAYYKWLHNLVEYREGAQLILNDDYEKELVHGRGRTYGLELFVSKTSGRFTGWLGYSLSFAQRQFDSLNNGERYFSRYDRRHDFSFVGAFDVTPAWTVSTAVLYATGSPFTGQTGQYLVPNPGFTNVEVLPVYTSRNAIRMSASFRIDLDVQYKFRLTEKLRGDVHVGIYNLLNRTQPGRVERTWDEGSGTYKYQQKGLFGAIPSLSVHFDL